MSLHIEQLNGDSTFLLTFAPPFAPEKHALDFPGSFTVLVDPWLAGSSSILHPRFQISRHVCDSTIKSLAELKRQPDLILISQDKPDHCHKETLCSLPKESKTLILATAAAAKKIQSWNHFAPGNIQTLRAYSSKHEHETVRRIPIAPFSTTSMPGEITIANIVTKFDMTSLHNAIGITYTAPGTTLTTRNGSFVDLRDLHMSPQASRPRTIGTNIPTEWRARFLPVMSPDPLSQEDYEGSFRTTSASGSQSIRQEPLRIDSANSSMHASQPSHQTDSAKIFSIIYTPHGVSYPTLKPYIDNYLAVENSLPLDALFHSINLEQNPRLMGGLVANGAPGGAEIASALQTRHWISAHDEVKDNRGWATTWIKSRHFAREHVERLLANKVGREDGGTKVHVLGAGGRLRIGPSSDDICRDIKMLSCWV